LHNGAEVGLVWGWPAMQAYPFGEVNAITAMLDFKSRRRFGREESATKGVGISRPLFAPFPQLLKILQTQHDGYNKPTFWHLCTPRKIMPALQAIIGRGFQSCSGTPPPKIL